MQLRPIAGLAMAAALTLGVVGCTAGPPAANDETTPSISQTDPSVATETSEAPAEPAGENADAPIAGWPAEVPVPDGTLQQDASTDGQVVGAFQVADMATAEAYGAELEAAGFAPTEGGTTEIAGASASVYQGNGYIVATSTVEAGDMVLLSIAIQSL